MLVVTIFLLSAVVVSWSKSVPPPPPPVPYDPRELWDMLKTAPQPDRPTEYPRVKPIFEEYGLSPSALYLVESYRLLGLNQLTADSISAFSANTYDDINQLRLTRPSFQHLYKLDLSHSAIRQHFTQDTRVTLWIPIYNQELARQINHTEDTWLRICVSQKERRRKQDCHILDTTPLDLADEGGQTWIGLDLRDLVRKEVASGSTKKHLYLYFTLNGCVTQASRCTSASLLGDSYREVLELSSPRVPFVIMLDS